MIRQLRSTDELHFCVDMYLSYDDGFMPSSRIESLRNLKRLILANKFVRVSVRDDKIIGWIYADVSKVDHQDYSNFQQYYFCSNQQGTAAFRVIKELHEAMYEEAKTQNVKYCVSPGSHIDESFVFTRCLEKLGWQRRGHVAIKEVVREVGTARYQVPRGRGPFGARLGR